MFLAVIIMKITMNLNKFKYIIPSLIPAIIIFILSHQPNVKIPDIGIGIEDKILHIAAYFIFGLCLVYSITGIKKGINNRTLLTILLLIGASYALSDEIHQYYVPGRESDIADFIADVAGIIISYFFHPSIRKIIRRFEKTNV